MAAYRKDREVLWSAAMFDVGLIFAEGYPCVYGCGSSARRHSRPSFITARPHLRARAPPVVDHRSVNPES